MSEEATFGPLLFFQSHASTAPGSLSEYQSQIAYPASGIEQVVP